MSKRERFDADDLAYEAQFKESQPKSVPRERCRKTGKIIWRKPSKAANAAKQMRTDHADPFIEHYLCEHCGFWHVGHAAGTQQRREQLTRSTGDA